MTRSDASNAYKPDRFDVHTIDDPPQGGADGPRRRPVRADSNSPFVDFDNIQINLADDDRDAATAFARNPER